MFSNLLKNLIYIKKIFIYKFNNFFILEALQLFILEC